MKWLLILMLLSLGNVWADQINVETKNGEQVSINTDDYDAVFSFATWCPYSRVFAKILDDPTIKPFVKSKRLVFIMRDEWQVIESILSQDYGPKEAETKLHNLKAKSRDKYIAFPAVANELSVPYYFVFRNTVQDYPISIQGYPEAYDTRSHKFNYDSDAWLKANGVPDSILDTVKKKYSLK